MMHFLNNAFSMFVLYYGERIAFLNDEQIGVPMIIAMLVLAVICTPVGIKVLGSDSNVMHEEVKEQM